MKSLAIVVRPRDAALSIGGHTPPRHGGDHATARDVDGRPIIPASALRGALRLELERLLRGLDPEARACSANRPDEAEPCDCPVCRVFGQGGTAAGSLRLQDAVLVTETGRDRVGDEDRVADVDVRSRVSISRQRRAAVDKLLGFVETTPLLGADTPAEFRAAAWLVPAPDTDPDEDLRILHAACAALRGIGGGKARGLGWVSCEVMELDDTPPAETTERQTPPENASTTGLDLAFEAQAPLHLGLGPPLGYFQPTRRHALGSTVRGAVAFALLEHGIVDNGDDPVFQRLLKASFGSARTAGDRPSVTRRHCRPRRHVSDNLVTELLRRLAAEAGLGLAVDPERTCPEPGCRAVKMVPEPYVDGAARPKVRVRTRTAINRRAGTSMDAKLFSQEALEPWMTADTEGALPRKLVLTATAWELDEDTSALLAKLDGHQVWLGGKRSQGMGSCRLRVTAPPEDPDHAPAASVLSEIASLKKDLVTGWKALAEVAQRKLEPILADDEDPVAVVLDEPWLPANGATGRDPKTGPLGIGEGVRLLGSFVRLVEEGRFGALESSRYGAGDSVLRGEDPPSTVVDAGSVYVYAIKKTTLGERLGDWLTDGREGCGERRGEGWGRFTIRGSGKDF